MRSALLVLAGLLGLPGRAEAARSSPPRGRVAVVVEGAGGEGAKAQVVQALEGFERVDDVAFARALTHEGQKGPLGSAFKGARSPGQRAAVDRTRRALGRSAADEAVVVVVSGKKGARSARVLVVSADDGVLSERTVKLDGKGASPTAVGEAVRARLDEAHPSVDVGPSLGARDDEPAGARARGDEREADGAELVADGAPGRDQGEAEAPRGPRPKHQVGREIAAVGVELGGALRSLSYSDKLTGDASGYTLPGAFVVGADAAVYPFAGTDVPVLSDLGLTGGLAEAVGLESGLANGSSASTTWRRWDVGVRGRLRVGKRATAPVLGLGIGYAAERFAFEGAGAAFDPELAVTDYRAARVLLDGRVPLGRFAVVAAAGPLVVLSAGSALDRYPRASVGGLDAELGGTFTIAAGFEARLTARYRRFFFAMNPEPGDADVTGGALDQSGRLTGGLAYVY